MNSSTITREQLCHTFDHTLLKADAKESDFIRLCKEAKENHFAMVAINSAPVSFCKHYLSGTDVHVGAAISFPLGQTSIRVKKYETEQAILDGADEIDYVLNIGALKSGNTDYIRDEMQTIVTACHTRYKLCKVIFENCYLTKEEICTAAEIALEIRPDYIKTSTGFGISGATVEDVRLMKKTVGDAVRVKAAGGICDWKTCAAMIDAGAERIGTSHSFDILREFDEAHK